MHQLIEMMKRVAAQVVNQRAQPFWGIVSSVDPSVPAVRLMRQPENVLTGWLPILQQSAGSGVTIVSMPLPGQQAYAVPDMGEAEHGVVVGFAHNNGAPLPGMPNTPGSGGTPSTGSVALAAGETGILGKGGQVIRLAANGDIYLKAGSGTVKIDGALTVNGTIVAQQDITSLTNINDLNGGSGSMQSLRAAYDAHKHTGITRGGASTDTTDHPV